jgi:hypothetical protein
LTTRRELLAEGLSYSAISRRVSRGALVLRYPGVYSFGPGELTAEAHAMAAVLASGPGAVLGLLSVACLWQISRWPVPVPHVLVPRHHRPVGDIVFQRYGSLDARDVLVYRGIPMTTVARMLVDLSEVLTAHQLAYVMHQAAFRKLLSVSAVWAAIERANGRHGLRVLKKALALHLAGSAGTRSDLEDTFLLIAEHLPEPLVNTACEGEEVDFLWPDRRLVVEVDGPGHLRPAARRNDARRDDKLRAAGYAVLRFTDADINQRPSEVIARLPF